MRDDVELQLLPFNFILDLGENRGSTGPGPATGREEGGIGVRGGVNGSLLHLQEEQNKTMSGNFLSKQ